MIVEIESKFKAGGRTFGRQYLMYVKICYDLHGGKKVSLMTHQSTEQITNEIKKLFGLHIKAKKTQNNLMQLKLIET